MTKNKKPSTLPLRLETLRSLSDDSLAAIGGATGTGVVILTLNPTFTLRAPKNPW